MNSKSAQTFARGVNMLSTGKEIPSSLDLLPLAYRFGDKSKASVRVRPSSRYSHIKATIDTNNKQNNTIMKADKDQRVVRRKGEHFGRIAP